MQEILRFLLVLLLLVVSGSVTNILQLNNGSI